MVKVIQVETDEQAKELISELAHTLHNLRFFTKYWNEHGGYQARKNMTNWQFRADALLDSLGLTLHNNINSVKTIKY